MRMACVGPRAYKSLGKKKELRNEKPHVTFGTAAVTKDIFGLFLLTSFASNIEMPKHQTNYDPTFTELTKE